MGWQEAHTQIRVQAYRCRWGYSETHLLCLCQSQRVFGTLSGWIAFLPLTPENRLSTPPLCGWQLPRQKLPRSYEQRTQKAASHTLWDAGCWLHVDQNSEQDTI